MEEPVKKTIKRRNSKLFKKCGFCGAVDTPEFRSGPNGSILCNKCGLRYRKHVQLRFAKLHANVKHSIPYILN